MNFQLDAIAARLRESAAEAARQATEAARGMTNLEAMAENDAYIHSGNDDYNNHQLPDDQDDNSTLSTHESAWLRQSTTPVPAAATRQFFPTVLSTSAHGHSFETSVVNNNNNTSIPLKVSVPERQSSFPSSTTSHARNNNNNARTTTYNQNHHDIAFRQNDSDEEENDDDEDDPIFSMIRSERKHQRLDPLSLDLEAGSEHDSVQHQYNSSLLDNEKNETKPTTKQHRFLIELDNRIAAEQKPQPVLHIPKQSHVQNQQQPSWLLDSLKRMGNNSSKDAPQKHAVSTAPLSRARQKHRSGDPDPKADLEHVALVSSSAMLGKEEMQALAALQSPSSPSILTLVISHPKEAFILFTLLLAAYVYFHSKSHT